MKDPFVVLGLTPSATPAEVRMARREIAKSAHPDAGGSESAMQEINAAAAAALRRLAEDASMKTAAGSAPDDSAAPSDVRRGERAEDGAHRRRDVPSFTVEALPVETFEALLLVAAELGELSDDDPPYELTVLMSRPLASWCRLSIVPDAGASTVSLDIADTAGDPLPAIDAVRNAWVDGLNRLDWNQF